MELDVGLTLADVNAVMAGERKVQLSEAARLRVTENRRYVERLVEEGRTVYGVTTGFGRFATTAIAREEVEELQHNLLRSHAIGVGAPLAPELVRAMLLLRAQSLAVGASGVRAELIDALLALLNAGVVPVVPSQGSVGASGDLAPLAHLALPLIGEGEAVYQGATFDGATALARAGLRPLALRAKEGLALINGTQLMTAHLVSAVARARTLLRVADIAAATSVEGLMGSHKPFHPAVTRLRPHAGARLVADNLRALLAGSEIVESHADCGRVQDAYSLRAVPQVHGASRDAMAHVRVVVEVEVNSVTDNPLILAAEDEVLSAGNFHGQPLALVADYAAIAMAELASISERRIEQLVNPALSGLPGFLTPRGGLNSGLMVAQYTAAALVSENKVLAHPASVDSIPTSANQEDHVSMGAHASRKLHVVLDNLAYVLSIEVLAGAQAIDFRAPLKPSLAVAAAHAHVRTLVAELLGDRYLKPELEALHRSVCNGELIAAVEAVTGELA